MDKKDFLGIMQKIKYAYGDRFQNLTDDMLATWYECLGGLEGERLRSAAIAYINENRFPPTIAELQAAYLSQNPSGVDFVAIYEATACCYPGGHEDQEARGIYLDKIESVKKDRREAVARQIEEETRRYVDRCERSGNPRILPFSEFLKGLVWGERE